MTNYSLIVLLLFATVSMHAQDGAIYITGSYNTDYRWMELSEYAVLQLFVQEKASVDFSSASGLKARFVKLSPEDAERLGHEHVAVAPINAMDPLDLSVMRAFNDKPVKLKIHQIGEDSQLFYTKDADYFIENLKKDYPGEMPFSEHDLAPDPLLTFFENIHTTDTLERPDFYDGSNHRYTRQFIDLLDSEAEVMLHSQMVLHVQYLDGTEGTEVEDTYGTEKLADLARRRLEGISRYVEKLPTPEDGAPKAEWEAWYHEWFVEGNPKIQGNSLVESRVWSVPVEQGNNPYDMALTADRATGRLYEFETRAVFDPKQNLAQPLAINEPRYVIINEPVARYVHDGQAYLLGFPYFKNPETKQTKHAFRWGEFDLVEGTVLEPTAHNYLLGDVQPFVAERMLIDGYFSIKTVHISPAYSVVHIQGRRSADERDGDYFLLTLETKTGKPIAFININDQLRERGLPLVDAHVSVTGSIDAQGFFVFTAQAKGQPGAVLLKLNQQLEVLHAVRLASTGDRVMAYGGRYHVMQLQRDKLVVLTTNPDLSHAGSKTFALPGQQFSGSPKFTILPDGRYLGVAYNETMYYNEISLLVADPETGKTEVRAIEQYTPGEESSDARLRIIDLVYMDGKAYVLCFGQQKLYLAEMEL